MRKSTFEFIKELLNHEVNMRKDRMMGCINNKFDTYLNDRINKYREVFDARDDFCEWADDQVFEEGEES